MTGLGVISNVGVALDEFWDALVAPEGHFSTPRRAPGLSMRVGAVEDETHLQGLPVRSLAAMDRSGGFAVAAAGRALAAAGLQVPLEDAERVAVVIGNAAGGQETIEEQYRRFLVEGKKFQPFSIVRTMVSSTASQVSMAFGAKGPCFVTSGACASSTHAIGIAASLIRSGVADVAIAGGSEACLTEGTLLAWEAMKIVSRSRCRPFSRNRDGLVVAEGAGALVLESEDHARSRGAGLEIELAGFGASADAGDLLQPSADGMGRAILAALRDADLASGDVDYVNAHGTGTRSNDITETEAMTRIFGRDARPPVSSTKAVTGHALGAAGAIEAVATVLAMRRQVAPPTANYDEPDPECDLDCIPNSARPMRIDAALSNSFGFGGLNATLAFRRAGR